MKPWQDFLLYRLGGAIAATFLFAPIAALFTPGIPVHRVITRTLQVSLMIALLIKAGPLRGWGSKLQAMGLCGPYRARRFAVGALVPVLLLLALLWASWALGGRPRVGQPDELPFLQHVVKAAITALAVSFFEEPLVRGYMKDALGSVGSALLFAGVHFFQPVLKDVGGVLIKSPPVGSGGYDPLLVFRNFHYMVEAWGDPQNATLGLLSLFLLAMALNRLRERTGSLYCGIGVHAGLVFTLVLYRRVLEGDVAGRWIYGGSRVHDGVLGTLALGFLCFLAYRAPLPRALRAESGTHG